jgi:hypothetical protein
MREWKKTHPLKGEARQRQIARSYANSYKKRGVLKPQPCQWCGRQATKMHHPDYDKPLQVEWLCDPCHHRLHIAADYASAAEGLRRLLAKYGRPTP